MAKITEQIREYNFSDAKLKQIADGILLNIDRDIAEFSKRGYTPAKKQIIQDYLIQFENMPSDDAMEGKKITLTQEKDLIKSIVEANIRTIMVMAENKFGVESGKFKQFGPVAISKLSDEQLVRTGKNAIITGKELLNELQSEGLTQVFLDEMGNKIKQFDNIIDVQLKAVRDRDIATDARVTLGNKIYNETMKLSNTGKDLWSNTNEAKYNDYVIYNTSTGETEDEAVPANTETPKS